MRQRRWAILSTCSLALAAVSAAWWVRGEFIADTLRCNPWPTVDVKLESSRGRFALSAETGGLQPGVTVSGNAWTSASVSPATFQPVRPFAEDGVLSFDFTNEAYGGHHLRGAAVPAWFVVVGFLLLPAGRYVRSRSAVAGQLDAGPTPRHQPGEAPDWNTASEAIECPLCDYNLRGLTEPRCPECGYTFEWAELTDPTRRRHRYLFEHQKRHRLWGFFATLTREFRPNRFWQTLHPAQAVNGFRLGLYGAVVMLVALAPALTLPWIEEPMRFFRMRPVAPTWGESLAEFMLSNQRAIAFFSIVIAIYPASTALSLMVFQQSMRRARVRVGHAMRCAIYSSDAVFWFGLWQVVVILWGSLQWQAGARLSPQYYLLAGGAATVLFTTLRIRSAYAHYMKFPHAAAIAILTQVMVILLLFTATVPTIVKLFLS